MKKNYSIDGATATIKISKNIYPKEVLVQACYVKLEDYYFLIDCDENNYIVNMSLKDGAELKDENIMEFFDELIESASYIEQLRRTSEIRSKILEAALLPQKKVKMPNLKRKQSEH